MKDSVQNALFLGLVFTPTSSAHCHMLSVWTHVDFIDKNTDERVVLPRQRESFSTGYELTGQDNEMPYPMITGDNGPLDGISCNGSDYWEDVVGAEDCVGNPSTVPGDPSSDNRGCCPWDLTTGLASPTEFQSEGGPQLPITNPVMQAPFGEGGYYLEDGENITFDVPKHKQGDSIWVAWMLQANHGGSYYWGLAANDFSPPQHLEFVPQDDMPTSKNGDARFFSQEQGANAMPDFNPDTEPQTQGVHRGHFEGHNQGDLFLEKVILPTDGPCGPQEQSLQFYWNQMANEHVVYTGSGRIIVECADVHEQEDPCDDFSLYV